MKVLFRKIKAGAMWMSVIAAMLSATACDDENVMDTTPAVGSDAAPSISMYYPTAGGKATTLTLYGSHLGYEIDNLRATVNGVEAEVTGAYGNTVTAVVPKGAGSGIVKLFVSRNGEEMEFTYREPFAYSLNPLVSTFAGSVMPGSVNDKTDGDIATATFWKPHMMIWGKDGALYVLEDDDNDIRRIKDGQVTTLLKYGDANGLLNRMSGMALSPDGNTLYIANDLNGKGSAHLVALHWKDGAYDTSDIEVIWGTVPTMSSGITNVAVHPETGDVFAVAHSSAEIYKLNKATGLMEQTGVFLPDGNGAHASKVKVRGFIFSADGTVAYMSSQNRHVLYRASFDKDTGTFSNPEILAGKYDTAAFGVGSAEATRFEQPVQIVLGPDGYIYVANCKKHRIVKVSPEGNSEWVTGQPTSGHIDGKLENAKFNHPQGLIFDQEGTLYIAEYWNHSIRTVAKD